MNLPYTIISADAHAGLPCEEYRPYLDPRYGEAFDAYLAERHAQRDQQMKLNYDYINDWETTHEEGLRGAYDAEQRDKELDADGVAAEVIFADADAITGMESPPFGAGLSAGTIEDPAAAFVVRRDARRSRGLARRPCRHRPGSDLPRHHARRRRDRVARRHAGRPRDHGADDVARPAAVQPSRLRPGVGRVPGGRVPGAHAFR